MGQGGEKRWGTIYAGIALLGVLACALSAARSAAADPPYEPNDAIPSAVGPLSLGQSYSAALESAADRDFFFFYVTSPTAVAVALAVQNLGGGSKASDIEVTILDTTMAPMAAQTFIRDGEARTVAAELGPQKYFVEVSANEGSGDSYALTPGGDEGAFGPFSQISGRCERAVAAGGKAERGLRRAKSKLQRATGRVRRSRYAQPKARLEARRAHSAAKRKVDAKRSELRAARRSMQPWCSITP